MLSHPSPSLSERSLQAMMVSVDAFPFHKITSHLTDRTEQIQLPTRWSRKGSRAERRARNGNPESWPPRT